MECRWMYRDRWRGEWREWKSEGGTQRYTLWDRKRGSSSFHPLRSQSAVTEAPHLCLCVCMCVSELLIHSPVWEGKGPCRRREGVWAYPPSQPRNVFAALEGGKCERYRRPPPISLRYDEMLCSVNSPPPLKPVGVSCGDIEACHKLLTGEFKQETGRSGIFSAGLITDATQWASTFV